MRINPQSFKAVFTQVYAIEANQAAYVKASKAVEAANLSKTIEVLRGHSTNLTLPIKVCVAN